MALEQAVITGMGLITPLGDNKEDNITNLLALRSGIKAYPRQDDPSPIDYYGKVECPIRPDMPKTLSSQYKFINRGGQLGLAASIEALKDHDLSDIKPEDRALFLATGDLSNTGCEFMYPANKAAFDEKTKRIDYSRLNKAALNKVNPFFLLDSIANNPFSFISAYFEFMGDNTTIASLSPCGSLALELASRSIRQGRASIALIIGSGSWINRVSLYEMEGVGILSRCRYGEASFMPFDRRRDGFIPSEGAAAIVLESESSAIKRGAHIYAKLLNIFSSSEHSGKGCIAVPDAITKRNISAVLKTVNKHIDELSFICAHGSGSRKGDASEMRSLINLFKEADSQAPVCALKPYTGHMGAASDLSDIILSLMALQRSIVPKTLNFISTEDGFSSLPVTKDIGESKRNTFLSVSNGLGSQSVAVVIERV